MSNHLNEYQQELKALQSRWRALCSEGKALIAGSPSVPSNQEAQDLEEKMQALTLGTGDDELPDLKEKMQALTLGDGTEGDEQFRERAMQILGEERRRVRDMEAIVVLLRMRYGSSSGTAGEEKKS